MPCLLSFKVADKKFAFSVATSACSCLGGGGVNGIVQAGSAPCRSLISMWKGSTQLQRVKNLFLAYERVVWYTLLALRKNLRKIVDEFSHMAASSMETVQRYRTQKWLSTTQMA